MQLALLDDARRIALTRVLPKQAQSFADRS